MKILQRILLLGIFTILFSGCGKYSSHYNAVGFVHSNTSSSAYMSFSSFDGTISFKLKCGEGERIQYSAELGEGSATVYYDCDGKKKLLFLIGAGEEVFDFVRPSETGSIYIIVETDGKCEEGKLKFDVEKN